MSNMATMTKCKTCAHSDKEGNGYYCRKWDRKCLVQRGQVDEDCVSWRVRPMYQPVRK